MAWRRSKYYFHRLKIRQWLGLRALKTLYFYFFVKLYKIKKLIERIFARNYEKIKKYLKQQTLGRWDNCSINPATQRIILKIVGFKELTYEFFLNSVMKYKCVWSENWCFLSQDQTIWRHQSVRSSEWLGYKQTRIIAYEWEAETHWMFFRISVQNH